MTSRAIAALGLGQCVNWGVLYYAFGVLLVPLSLDLATLSLRPSRLRLAR
jgi:hypothetical protein